MAQNRRLLAFLLAVLNKAGADRTEEAEQGLARRLRKLTTRELAAIRGFYLNRQTPEEIQLETGLTPKQLDLLRERLRPGKRRF